MTEDRTISLTIHGLGVDNGDVRADVFVDKLKALIDSVRVADSHVNGRKSHNLIVTDLASASAHATIQERVSVKRKVSNASPLVGQVLSAIYEGDQRVDRFPSTLVEALAPLAKDVSKRFSHAEIDFGKGNVIRIDDYFAKQMERALRRIQGDDELDNAAFNGTTFATFDGVVMEIDARGNLMRGKLILTAGGKELDCVFRKEDVAEMRNSFNKRARITAIAHFNGTDKLPDRLDVRGVQPLKQEADLSRWRGALSGRRVPQPEGL